MTFSLQFYLKVKGYIIRGGNSVITDFNSSEKEVCSKREEFAPKGSKNVVYSKKTEFAPKESKKGSTLKRITHYKCPWEAVLISTHNISLGREVEKY